MKKIYQITENVSNESGGVRTVLVNLNNYINAETSFESIILTNKKEKIDRYLEFPSTKFKSWWYATTLEKYINSEIKKPDLMHLHGVFMHNQYVSSKFASKNDISYIISPHGMLEPWHLKDKELKKKLYLKLLLDKILDKAKIIHAITPFEKENLYKLTKHKNIIEIPNYINYSQLPKNVAYNPSEDYLLFLSRLHPKKGLDILIKSMSKINNKTIKLKIVGADNEYSSLLKKLVQELGLQNRIEFLGSVYGDKKFELFSNAKAFIAPSYSEAIGMVNLEAAACKTPVVTTFNTGINPEWNNNGGIMIKPNIDELTFALNQVVGWTNEERIDRGNHLSSFVINEYSWEKKGHLWNTLYNSL